LYIGHKDWIRALSLSQDTGHLFSGANDGNIRKWEVKTGETLKVYKGHTAGISALCEQGGILYSASDDTSLRAWDVEEGTCVQVYQGHSEWVTSLCVTANQIYSGSLDKTIRIWNTIQKEKHDNQDEGNLEKTATLA